MNKGFLTILKPDLMRYLALNNELQATRAASAQKRAEMQDLEARIVGLFRSNNVTTIESPNSGETISVKKRTLKNRITDQQKFELLSRLLQDRTLSPKDIWDTLKTEGGTRVEWRISRTKRGRKKERDEAGPPSK